MAKFLAVFTGKPGAQRPDPATAERGMRAWGDWMTRNAARVIDSGGPLGPTKTASVSGVADSRNALAGYVIVEAEDHAAAAQLFEDHPHFSIFPGDGVDVMPILAIPTGP